VVKCVRTRQAIDDNIIRRMRSLCWINKATDTYSEFAVFSHGMNGYANAPVCYSTLSRYTLRAKTIRVKIGDFRLLNDIVLAGEVLYHRML
jgi:hypothetical protein